MFKRVVPNLERIGLLSDRILPRYEEAGLLACEHGRAAPDLTAEDLRGALTRPPEGAYRRPGLPSLKRSYSVVSRSTCSFSSAASSL